MKGDLFTCTIEYPGMAAPASLAEVTRLEKSARPHRVDDCAGLPPREVLLPATAALQLGELCFAPLFVQSLAPAMRRSQWEGSSYEKDDEKIESYGATRV